MTKAVTPPPEVSGVSPLFWRVLNAATACVDAGKPVTYANLARQLGRARQVVWKFFRRHPEVWAWIDDHQRTEAARYYGLVHRRMAHLAMQGSTPAAEVFCRMEAGAYKRDAAATNPDAPHGAVPVQVNILVPHPQLPQGGRLPAPALPAASSASPNLPPRKIPTVPVR